MSKITDTFPFPDGLTPDCPAATYAADPRAQAIAHAAQKLVTARNRWLNPPELVVSVPEVMPGFPDRLLPKDDAAAAVLKKRTLTALYNQRGTPEGAWLDALTRLLALNHERAAAEQAAVPDQPLCVNAGINEVP
jgi:hypothetical protein